MVYYVDPSTGKIYVANNEDYWYDAAITTKQEIPEERVKQLRVKSGKSSFNRVIRT